MASSWEGAAPSSPACCVPEEGSDAAVVSCEAAGAALSSMATGGAPSPPSLLEEVEEAVAAAGASTAGSAAGGAGALLCLGVAAMPVGNLPSPNFSPAARATASAPPGVDTATGAFMALKGRVGGLAVLSTPSIAVDVGGAGAGACAGAGAGAEAALAAPAPAALSATRASWACFSFLNRSLALRTCSTVSALAAAREDSAASLPALASPS